ncbi:MAG: proton-conducting transporter membrane subunit, partial [Chloroflexia bacterium]
IHALRGEQDIRYMGGLRDKMPWTFRLMALGALSLAGFPGLAGFFSKDAILIAALKSPPLLALAFLVSFITAAYSSRMLWAVFYGTYDRQAHDAHGTMLHPLWPLAIGTVIAGYFGPHQDNPWGIMATSAVVCFAGLYAGLKLRLPVILKEFFSKKWWINDAYEAVLVEGAARRGSGAIYWFDRNVVDLLPRAPALVTSGLSLLSGWVDRVLVDGVVKTTAGAFQVLSYPVRLAQTGRANQYALVIVITVAATFGWYWLQ